MLDVSLSVSDFVALLNQTLEFAYPSVRIVGELANFRISKNKWLYFDLKDELANVKFFGTVFQLPGPLEDGLMLEVCGQPRLHPQYGFSLRVQSIKPVGEGSLKRAASLLETKLRAEGLFDESHKRSMPYPPTRIGLITSAEAAAYGDFMKILQQRWGGLEIDFIDTQVQGEPAVDQIIGAISHFNVAAHLPEVLVITRGGGSAEDLQVFNNEAVIRAIATSRVPTLLAIGHERDVSLAEQVADCRASTPSNAAELLVPDRQHQLQTLRGIKSQLSSQLGQRVVEAIKSLQDYRENFSNSLDSVIHQSRQQLNARAQLLAALAPQTILARGYAIVRKSGKAVTSGHQLKASDTIDVYLADAALGAVVKTVILQKG